VKSESVRPTVPKCTFCENPAIVYRKEVNHHLCKTHFIADVELRVISNIEKKTLISDGDRIAIALSGGKDSTALLLLLYRLLPCWNDVHLIAITIDEGIAGYRVETIRSAQRLAHQFDIEHRIISFDDIYGNTLDSLLRGKESQACSICGILRKKALDKGARDVGATKLATGHNLDDEAQSALMNVLRDDLPRLVRNSSTMKSPYFIPRIKPLSDLSEKDIATYLLIQDAWTDLPECPYTHNALRREVRSMLSDLEYRYPGTMLRIMDSKRKIEHYLSGIEITEPLRHCKECGDPSSGEVCQVCLIKRSFSH